MFKFLSVLVLSTSMAFASGTAKLADFLINGAGVVEVLGKYGIKGEDAQAVKSYVNSALRALSTKGDSISRSELSEILTRLPVTGQDANVRKELQLLLEKSDSQFSKDDVVKAINNIIYLANRHGKSVIITCADCVNENLARNGFKFTVEAVKNSKTLDLLNSVIPSEPAQLQNFIATRMRRLGLGDYSKVTPALVAPTEEKSLAVFLAMAENGSAEQKAFVEAVKKISKGKDGKVNIIDAANPHKFWRELSSDIESSDLKGITGLLEEAAVLRQKDSLTAEQAFYKVLKAKSDKDPSLKSNLEKIMSKRCFFK